MDKIKTYLSANWKKILGVIGALIVAYAAGNIKTVGDLVSVAFPEASNKAAVSTIENNTGGEVAVVKDNGKFVSPVTGE